MAVSNTKVEVDISSVMAMYKEFGKKERKYVFRNTIRESLNIVKKQAVKNLETVINPRKIRKKDKYNNSFQKGIKIKVYKGGMSGVIHIMSNFKMKFFELGTEERYNIYKTRNPKRPLKKKRNTGRIKPSHFFVRAKKSKENEVFKLMDKRFSEMVTKINNKYHNK